MVMGCETSQKRFAACKTLLDYGFANFALVVPALPEDTAVPVKLGEADRVAAVLSGEETLLIRKEQKSQIRTQLTLEPEVSAPVRQGQRLGTLEILAGQQMLAQIPLVAAAPVEKLSFGKLLLQVLDWSLSAPIP